MEDVHQKQNVQIQREVGLVLVKVVMVGMVSLVLVMN